MFWNVLCWYMFRWMNTMPSSVSAITVLPGRFKHVFLICQALDKHVFPWLMKWGITSSYNVLGIILRWKNLIYLLEIDILRNCSRYFWVVLWDDFWGFGCPGDAQTPYWLRLCSYRALSTKPSVQMMHMQQFRYVLKGCHFNPFMLIKANSLPILSMPFYLDIWRRNLILNTWTAPHLSNWCMIDLQAVLKRTWTLACDLSNWNFKHGWVKLY